MIHKKDKHRESVPICRNSKNGLCEFSKCWFRHSHLPSTQPISPVLPILNPQDFPQLPPPPQPPAQLQAKFQSSPHTPTKYQVDMQHMITQMAMSLNTMKLQFKESRKQMHTLQQMLAQSQI